MSKEHSPTNSRELEDIYYTLQEYLQLYSQIIAGQKFSTPEITKNVQNSIKELCTLIMQKTSN